MMIMRKRKAAWDDAYEGSLQKMIFLPIIMILTLTAVVHPSSARSLCPADKGGNDPCDCVVKKDGVVLVCDRTKLHDVEKAMTFYREREVVINYLTIRQSHVGRLPNGFFMGKKQMLSAAFSIHPIMSLPLNLDATKWLSSDVYTSQQTE